MSVVKTNPALVTENVIQATADVPDLTLRPFSDAQTSPIIQIQNADGTAEELIFNATKQGLIGPLIAQAAAIDNKNWNGPSRLQLSGVGGFGNIHSSISLYEEVNAASKLGVNSTEMGVFNPAAPSPLSPTFTEQSQAVYDDAGNLEYMYNVLDNAGGGWLAITVEGNVNGTGRVGIGLGFNSFPLTPILAQLDGQLSVIAGSATTKGITCRRFSGASTADLQEWQDENGVKQLSVMPNGKDLSFDNANGTMLGQAGQKVSVLGAAPVSQQTGGAATATLVYTATEQAMIQKAYDCLRAFGFLS